jgi:hypothetical protein
MEVNKIEFIGEVCEHKPSGGIDHCRTGLNDGCISSKHRESVLITLRLWVDKEHFSHPVSELLETGKYKVVIERIEDTDAG